MWLRVQKKAFADQAMGSTYAGLIPGTHTLVCLVWRPGRREGQAEGIRSVWRCEQEWMLHLILLLTRSPAPGLTRSSFRLLSRRCCTSSQPPSLTSIKPPAPGPTPLSLFTLCSHLHTSLPHTHNHTQVLHIISAARSLIAQGACPWACLTVWGFPQAPVAWREHEHRLDARGMGSTSQYSVFLLPEGGTLLLRAMGGNDAHLPAVQRR